MFESQNEELGWDSLWNRYSNNTNGKAESYGYANQINQTFVDLVRASGGNNAEVSHSQRRAYKMGKC